MSRLIIADIKSPNNKGISTGHFFAVADNYYKMFSAKVKTLIAGGPIYSSRFDDSQLLHLPNDVMLSGETLIKSKLKYMQNSWMLFKQAKGDTIIVQQGGVLTSFITIALFYHRKSRLFLIQYSREGVDSKLKKLLYSIVKHKIDGIICPNRMVGEAYARPYCVVPDYIYIGDSSRQPMKTYKDKKYDFCMIGRISPEKGIVNVARLLCNTKYKVLIAGKPQNDELAKSLHDICDDSSNIVLRLDYVSDADYLDYLNDSRYAILNYSGEYSKRSSGVVFDTLFNGVPVIGCRCSALQFIEDRGLGMLCGDIMQFNPEIVLNEEFHEECLNNIASYKKSHEQYKKELWEFVL